MRKTTIVLALAAALAAGCLTKAQTAQLTTAAGGVCQIVVQATDPMLVPLCTTADQIALALEALGANQADAGVSAAPMNDQVYSWLKAHGAQPVAQ